jgi:asparagine synthase (glutamine-hydrolysing)
MAGIAGITAKNANSTVQKMLGIMRHRGNLKQCILERDHTTYGITWNEQEDSNVALFLADDKVCNFKGSYHLAWAKYFEGSFYLHRDKFGIVPLYYGWDQSSILYFASEVKALLPFISKIFELAPGTDFNGKESRPYFEILPDFELDENNPGQLAAELRTKLENSVKGYINSNNIGSWLSGGLDSSAICAIAAKHIQNFSTFAAGIKGAPDLEYARDVSSFIGSKHHEVIITMDRMIEVLPMVIYHLESFDTLLVRSSLTNYWVAREAAQYVSEVFSGEGGDELFAGYEYLKSIPESQLQTELVKLTKELHYTALQRVDRCSSAHGTTAFVPFLNPEMVKLAFSIPVRFKILNNIEKWILRKAMYGELPEKILHRTKSKFWEGSGVKDMISDYAEKKISRHDFSKERILPNGWILNTREELLYYNIFKEHFGSTLSLEWMGRTENGTSL